MCPRCGLATARPLRQDQYLSLFFIPLIPVKRGEVYYACSRCGTVSDSRGGAVWSQEPPPPNKSRPQGQTCVRCGQPLDPSHNFCPNCGQRG